MDISFEPAKSDRYVQEWGLPFTMAQDFEWDSAMVFTPRAENTRHQLAQGELARGEVLKLKSGTVLPTPAEDDNIKKQMRQDPQNPEWTKKAFVKARPASDVLPGIIGEETA